MVKSTAPVLAFFAHPDDEVMLAGGTLYLLAQSGIAVHYLCATRGEGGEVGEPPICSKHELGSVRESEMRCAVQHLNGKKIQFLDYIDPPVGPNNELYPYAAHIDSVADQLIEEIMSVSAGAIITHGSNGEYGHPAHILTHKAVIQAAKLLGRNSPNIYTVSASFDDHPKAHISNPDDPADLVLDITPVMDRKIDAALCHRTQHALFVRRASQQAHRQLSVPEVIVHLESLHRVFPPATSDPDPIFALLEPWSYNPLALNT